MGVWKEVRGAMTVGFDRVFESLAVCDVLSDDAAQTPSHDAPPSELSGFEIVEKLGEGGMGVVYKGYNRRLDRFAAIKILLPAAHDVADSVERFEREIKAAARLEHPNIVAVYHADECAGMHYLIMQFIEGMNLRDLVRRRGPLNPAQAVNIALQAAQGFDYAHRQRVVHRDVKPSNLLVDRGGVVKILDLGLARMADSPHDELTQIGEGMGTAGYAAPEQAADARQADFRSDIYSLGCTLYYLLAGRAICSDGAFVDFRQSPPPSLRPLHGDVSPDLEAVFRRMIAARPAERFQSMADVAAALRSCMQTLPRNDHSGVLEDFTVIPAAPTSRTETVANYSADISTRKSPTSPRRRPAPAILNWSAIAATAFVTAAIAAAGVALLSGRTDQRSATTRPPAITTNQAEAPLIHANQSDRATVVVVESGKVTVVLIPSQRANDSGDESTSAMRE